MLAEWRQDEGANKLLRTLLGVSYDRNALNRVIMGHKRVQ